MTRAVAEAKRTVAKISELFNIQAPPESMIEVRSAGPHTPTVNPLYHFRTDLVRPVLMWLAGIGGNNLLLVGPMGTGKSSLIEQVSAKLGREVLVVQCHGRADPSYFVGQLTLAQAESGTGTVTKWVDAPLTAAMRKGAIVILDEYDVLPPDTVTWLHRLRDSRTIHIPETGEYIEAHPDFRISLTGNTGGSGDQTGAYRGTKTQNAAFLDGLSVVSVPYMETEEEIALVCSVLGSRLTPALKEVVRCMVQVADSVRSQFELGEIYTTISTRSLLRWAELTWAYSNISSCSDPLLEGLKVALMNRALKEDQRAVYSILAAARSN